MAFPKHKDIEIPLLKALIAAGGRATPKEAVERVTRNFPALTPADLTMKQPSGYDLKWPNRVAWVRNALCEKGAIDRTVRGTWVITEIGQQVVVAAQASLSPLLPLLAPSSSVTSVRPSPVVTLGNPLYHRLRTTAKSGTDATAFEEALAEAFRVLGFDAVTIGGRGDTDIRATAPLGKHQYIAIVDAKSSRNGKVADRALHYPSLHDHREKNQADYVMVVAPGFNGGNRLCTKTRVCTERREVAQKVSSISHKKSHENLPRFLHLCYILELVTTRQNHSANHATPLQ